MKKALLFLTIIAMIISLAGCGSETKVENYDELAGSYRMFVFSDESGTAYDENTLNITEHLYLDITGTGEVALDYYDFSTNEIKQAVGTHITEVSFDVLENLAIDAADWDNADHYYKVEFENEEVCYLGQWTDAEVIEVFYNGCQYSFFPESHDLFDVLTIEDILGEEGIYCLHADGSVTKANVLTKLDEDFYFYSGAEPLVIDRAKGDQLIYIGDMVYFGYSNQNTFEMERSVEKYYWSGTTVDFFDIVEFEGQNIEGMFTNSVWLSIDATKFLDPYGFAVSTMLNGYDGEAIILSKEPTEYTYGLFEGTDWVETTEYNDIPYYETLSYGNEETDWDYVFQAPVIKGKEGYFTIDLANVEAGLYMHDFDSGSFDEYVFDIR